MTDEVHQDQEQDQDDGRTESPTRRRAGRGLIGVAAAAALVGAAALARATDTSPRPGPNPAVVTPKMEPPPEARAISEAFARTARALRPSVVRIDVEIGGQALRGGGRRAPGPGPTPGQPRSEEDLRRFFQHFFNFGEGGAPDLGPPTPGRGTGSGVILDTKGEIVTNSHVVERASKVTVVLFDGQEIPAKVIGRDPRTDLALVRLDRVPNNLVAARLGDSDKLDVGEWVLAIGSPLGLDQTVTAGIISGKGHVGRNVRMSGERVRTYISTDAKINPGNSGGPLVNLDGEVIGINTLINTGPGGAYGFAIPVNEVRRVSDVLLREGRVRYPYLGVKIGDLASLDPAAKQKLAPGAPDKGALVSDVTPGSPAAKVGLRAGDIITKIDSQKIETAGDVIDYVSSKKIGEKVTVNYLRDGHPASVAVALGELPSDEEGAPPSSSAGMSLQTLTPDLAGSLGLPAGTKGAAIADVQKGSVADRAGLQPGDVILEVDRKPAATADEAASAIQQVHKGGHLLRVAGAHGTRFVMLPTGG
jgi:serine protease Do